MYYNRPVLRESKDVSNTGKALFVRTLAYHD